MTTINSVNNSLSGQTGTANFVGSTAPTFTTSWAYAATGFNILDNNGNRQISFTTTANAVNYFTLANAATLSYPTFLATGSDSNIGINFEAKGTGNLTFSSTLGINILTVNAAASAVNGFSMTAEATGTGPVFLASGSDSNVSMNIETKGTGSFTFISNATTAPATAFSITPSSTPVNWITATSANTTVAPAFTATGSDTNILLQLNGKGNKGVGTQGTSTNDNAVAGNVGEELEAHLVFASSFGLTTNTTHDLLSLSLTAGDWDVWGNVLFSAITAASTTQLTSWLSTTSATLPDASLQYLQIGATMPATSISQTPPSQRFSLSGSATVYLSVRATFAAGSPIVCGNIYARRIR